MSRTTRRCWSTTVLAAAAGLVLAGCGRPAEPAPAPRIDTAFELPGDRVYPEGVAVDEHTGDVYVGSYADGTIYRNTVGATRAEVFLPPGTDGRRTANGLRIDRAGRLWVLDSTAGAAVYDLGSRRLRARFDVPGTGDRFVNDIAFGPDGTAYLTDSRRHLIYQVTPADLDRALTGDGHGELGRAFDLASALEPHGPDAYTLNGIVTDPTGAYLLTADTTGGDLYRVALTPGPTPIRRVNLVGGELTLADGLDLDGTTLRAAHNTDDIVSTWTLSDTGDTATRTAEYHDDALGVPTTLVHDRDRVLVVASQFDKGGPLGTGTPTDPFRVLAVTGL